MTVSIGEILEVFVLTKCEFSLNKFRDDNSELYDKYSTSTLGSELCVDYHTTLSSEYMINICIKVTQNESLLNKFSS